jgi:hypothetical protein
MCTEMKVFLCFLTETVETEMGDGRGGEKTRSDTQEKKRGSTDRETEK